MYPTPAMPSWPGRRRLAMRPKPSPSAPIHHFSQRSPDLPLSGAQIILTLDPVTGGGQGQVGPAGIGTIWNPASATFSTNITPFDGGSVVNLYLGPSNVPNTLIGTILGGNGVLAIALPPMSPGLYLIAVWTTGTPSSVVSMNVIGTYSTLTRG